MKKWYNGSSFSQVFKLPDHVYFNLLQGMPGAPGMKMYSREDLMNQNFGDEDAEDEDDDEADLASKLVRTRSNTV